MTSIPAESSGPLAVALSRFGDVHVSIRMHMDAAPALLQRPFVAMWKAMARMMDGTSSHLHDIGADLAPISDAVNTLRIGADGVGDAEALGHVVMLGRCLVHFDLATTGRSAHVIYRHVLGRVNGYHSRDGCESETVDIMGLSQEALALVWMDTLESLIRRRVPVVRCASRVEEGVGCVDNYTGIASTLLPLLYEICQLGAAVKVGITTPQSLIDRVEHDVKKWEPICPANGIDEGEAISLITHANLHRIAALSLLQELQDHRHPGWNRWKHAALVSNLLSTLEHCHKRIGYTPPSHRRDALYQRPKQTAASQVYRVHTGNRSQVPAV